MLIKPFNLNINIFLMSEIKNVVNRLIMKLINIRFLDTPNYADRYPSILLYLLPVALITGPFLSDLFLILIGLYFLIISLKRRLFSYYQNLFVYLFLFFYFYLLLRSFFSEDIYYSLEGCLFYFRYLFFSLGVFYLFNNVPNLARNLGLSIFFTLLIVALDGYYQWIYQENIFGWKLDNPDRLAGFFRDEKIIGGYLARLTPLCLGLLVYGIHLSRIKLFIGLAFLICIDVLTFGSGERSAFFFMTSFTLILIFLSNKFKFVRLITFIISSIIITIITINVPTSNQKVMDTFDQVTTNNIAPLAPYSPLHEQHYIVGLKMFKTNPIFGKGPNMFDILCQKDEYNYLDGCTNHPHNSYIQLLAETGLIGFMFLFFAFTTISIILFRHFLGNLKISNYNLPEYMIFLLAGTFFMTWPLIPTGSFFNNWTNVMYYLPIGFILHYFYNNKIEKSY